MVGSIMLASKLTYKYFKAVALTLAIASVSALVHAEDHLKSHELKVLRSPMLLSDTKVKKQSLNTDSKPMITMIYQPACPWCKRQSETLAKLVAGCAEHLTINIVGYKGSKQTLKRELKHYSKYIPAYLANNAFLREVGGIKASPTTLFYNEKGQLVSKQRGFIENIKLLQAASILTEQQCNLSI